jgi:hypothetical protein
MAELLGGDAGWPPRLAVFDPNDWPPQPGATLEACRCTYCTERSGAALPPDVSTSVAAARRRWRQARVDFLGEGHPLFKLEVLAQIREMSAPAEVP